MQHTSQGTLAVHEADSADLERIWSRILEPIVRSGESLSLPQNTPKGDALSFWAAEGASVFIAELVGGGDEGTSNTGGKRPVASYFLTHKQGQAGHVASCAFIWEPTQVRARDVDEAVMRHAMQQAALDGFRSVQCDNVVSTNETLVNLCKKVGFREVGRLPGAFDHPTEGFIDTLILHKLLDQDDLAGWIKTARTAPSPTRIPDYTEEDVDEQEELNFIKQMRASASLPAAQQLPPPDFERPANVGENGYERGRWDLGHLVHYLAYKLDTLFFARKPPPGVSIVPSYGPL